MKHVVLLKSKSGSQGGLEKYAARIASAFIEKGAKVTILNPKTIPWPGFLKMEQYDWHVRTWLKQNKADIVFGMDRNRYQTHIRAGNGVHASYLESRIITEGKLKNILCKFNPLHRKILELEKCAFENPSLKKLFTNSYMVRDQVLQHYLVDPSKIQVIHNGVEWDEMEPDFANWEAARITNCQKLGLDPNRFQFLFIGHGYLRKGLDCLLIGLSRLKFKDFSLSVIGKDSQIDLYRAKAVQLGLKDNVHFFGPAKDVRLFYQLADTLVIPSFYDPFANVTVEALAMGLYVVSSKKNGGHEILTPESGAIIEDLLDPDAVTRALEKAICHSKTTQSAIKTRQSIKYLNFSNQMRILMDATYE